MENNYIQMPGVLHVYVITDGAINFIGVWRVVSWKEIK